MDVSAASVAAYSTLVLCGVALCLAAFIVARDAGPPARRIMELIAIAGTVVALAAVIGRGRRLPSAATRSEHRPMFLEGLEQASAELRTRLAEVRRDVTELQAVRFTEPERPTEEVPTAAAPQTTDRVDDHLEEQIYFALRGVIAASTLGAPMQAAVLPGSRAL